MTQEEKAKRYDEAIKRAKKVNKCEADDREPGISICEYIFPEIHEPEDKDEQIRKDIIKMVTNTCKGEWFINSSKEECLSWLEKQGEQKAILNVPTRDVILSIWDLGNEWKELTNGCISTEYGTQLTYIQKHWHESEYYLKEKQGEQKPIDKVEPKFHVGDWIIFNGLILYINEVVEGYYRTISIGGIPNSYDWDIDDIARLWTIQDAKDGDVLCEGDNVDGDTIFIFKERLNDESIITYCDYDKGELNDSCNLFCYNVMPATKEQRDLLFKKMKEAGYEWNEEKKDPKKIVAPKFNIHDCVVKKHNSNINDFGYFIITDITDGKYWYNDRIICDIREQDEWELYEPVRQKPTAWSDEDERTIKEIDEIIYECPYCESKEEISNWLKSIKQRIGG